MKYQQSHTSGRNYEELLLVFRRALLMIVTEIERQLDISSEQLRAAPVIKTNINVVRGLRPTDKGDERLNV